MATPELLLDGPDDAPLTCILAHGAGAGMRHPFLAAVAAGLAERRLRVARFEFDYMAARARGERRPPDRAPQLLARFRQAVAAAAPRGPVALLGKSMGGRMATMLADELPAAAVVVFGYPFHPPKQPDTLRTAHLAALRTPTLILQGERDEFGTRAEVAAYTLSPAIAVQWLVDGDHSFKPRQASGHTAAGHLATAIAASADFLLAQLRGQSG